MKRVVRKSLTLLLCLTLVFCCVPTGYAATETAAEKLYDLTVGDDYTLEPQDADGNAITASSENVDEDDDNETVYANVEKLELTFTGTANTQYGILLLYNSEVPTDGNIRYIDQLVGVDGEMTYTVYPDKLSRGGKYFLYISTADDYTQEASFSVAGPAYELGDVNEDGYKDSEDAAKLLRAAAKLDTLTESQELAADVNGDSYADATDAGLVLRYAAKLITKFPIEE